MDFTYLECLQDKSNTQSHPMEVTEYLITQCKQRWRQRLFNTTDPWYIDSVVSAAVHLYVYGYDTDVTRMRGYIIDYAVNNCKSAGALNEFFNSLGLMLLTVPLVTSSRLNLRCIEWYLEDMPREWQYQIEVPEGQKFPLTWKFGMWCEDVLGHDHIIFDHFFNKTRVFVS